MRPPPGAPITARTRPSSSTMVGEMVELRTRQSLRAGAVGSVREKSTAELFRKNPSTHAPEPKYGLSVLLSATALPSLSTTERCVVSPSGISCRSEEHTSELQSRENLVCRLLLEKKKEKNTVRVAATGLIAKSAL